MTYLNCDIADLVHHKPLVPSFCSCTFISCYGSCLFSGPSRRGKRTFDEEQKVILQYFTFCSDKLLATNSLKYNVHQDHGCEVEHDSWTLENIGDRNSIFDGLSYFFDQRWSLDDVFYDSFNSRANNFKILKFKQNFIIKLCQDKIRLTNCQLSNRMHDQNLVITATPICYVANYTTAPVQQHCIRIFLFSCIILSEIDSKLISMFFQSIYLIHRCLAVNDIFDKHGWYSFDLTTLQ